MTAEPQTFSVTSMLARVVDGDGLTEAEAAETMNHVMRGEVTQSQLAALLTAMRMKGITSSEITGFARALREHVVPVDLTDIEVVVDTCGTGGDGPNTFNISTAAALVVAGAGVAVAKHGNRSVTSLCGSADVLETLGVVIDLPADAVATTVREAGIGFMFAPGFHPGFRHAGPVRKEIGFRTVFNVLGPMTNPAGVRRQIIGISDPTYARVIAEALANLGSDKVMVVYSSEGLDEIGLSGATYVTEYDRDRGEVVEYHLDPADHGLAEETGSGLQGSDVDTNATIIRSILAGDRGAPRDVVLLNAAAALYVAGKAGSIPQGIEIAAEAIDSGRAAETLQKFVEVTNRIAANGSAG